MKRKLLLFVVTSFFLAPYSKAIHIAGGEITYKYIGNEKYEVTFKLYRDCREAATNSANPSFFIYEPSVGKTSALNASLVSIIDISTTCRSGPKCNPSNKQISTSIPIYEEHTYRYTLDFNGNESGFKNYCLMKLYMYGCCRSDKINTGPRNITFYMTSDLDICKAKNNSSPVFVSLPQYVIALNQPAYLSFSAKDTVDNDSLSYQFSQPMNGLTSFAKWDTGYSYNFPLNVYWPAGYNKAKGPNPNVNPPIGLYLDPESGGMVFLPTNTETTVVCVAVKEWRKDSTGKYQQIGEIKREITLFELIIPDNNPPLLNGPYKYDVCAGNQICFTISSDDKTFVPPPPAKTPLPDTVTLTWNKWNIKNASFTIVDPNARLKKAKFCWTPAESDASDIPYTFNVTANDNHCQLNLRTTKSYSVTVKQNAKTQISIKHISNNVKVLQSQITQPFKGTPRYTWQVLDSAQRFLPASYYFFKRTKSTTSNWEHDTVIFRKEGKYFVMHTINNLPLNCPTVYFDTIKIPKVIDVNFFKTMDTSVCKGTSLNFKAILVNGTAPYLYKWGTGKPDTVSQFNFKVLRDTIIELEVTDAKGQKAYSWCSIKILKNSVNAGLDKAICKMDSVALKAVASNFGGPISYTWFFKGNKIGNQNLINATKEGMYKVEATDNGVCFSTDSVLITNLPLPIIELYDGSFCQNKNSLANNELIKSPVNINLYKNTQWKLLRTLKNPKGAHNSLPDLLTDTDTSSKYNFLLEIDKSKIDLGTSRRDSLIFSITVTDGNNCKASDTNKIIIKKSPTLYLKYTRKAFCRSDELDLDSLVNHDGDTQTWTKVNQTGYENYPTTGDLKNGIITPDDFYKNGGLYQINLSIKIGDCETKGSMGLDVWRLPVPIIEKKETKDLVVFTDKSSFANGRSWYLDTSFISNAISITLDKNLVNGKSISLRLKNEMCDADTQFMFHAVSIKNIKKDFIKIYPNPTNDYLTIQQVKPFNGGSFEIYNSLGKLVLKGDLIQKETQLNICQFASGLYFLSVKNEKMTVSFQFVKTE